MIDSVSKHVVSDTTNHVNSPSAGIYSNSNSTMNNNNSGNESTNINNNSAALQFLAKLHNESTATQSPSPRSTQPTIDLTHHRSHSRSHSRYSNHDYYNDRRSISNSRDQRHSSKRSRSRSHSNERHHSSSRSRHNNEYDNNNESNDTPSTSKLFDVNEIKRLAELAKIAKQRGITVKELMDEQRQQHAVSTNTNTSTIIDVPPLSAEQQQLQLEISGSKGVRKLFIGNLPISLKLTESTILEFIESAIRTLGIHTVKPILSVWLNHDSSYTFIEFRSVMDCTICYSKLQGISLAGRLLHIGRPNDYKSDNEVKYSTFVVPLTTEQQAELDQQNKLNNATNTTSDISSNVILLENMIDESELVDDSEYNDLCSDVRDECSKYGTILQCIIPRTNQSGAGNIYIQYSSINDASNAISALNNRTFSGEKITVTPYDQQLFNDKVYNNSS